MPVTKRTLSPRTIAILLWLAGLFLLSMLPIGIKHELHTTGMLHRWGHLILFTITAALLCARRAFWTKLLFLLITVLIGFSLEWLEDRVWHNGLEWRDIRTDAIGACLGAAITRLGDRRRPQDRPLA